MRRDTDELLAAYVDGISELTPAERRRVEARIANEPSLRDDANATRDLLSELRELPPSGDEPSSIDWNALERSISDAVGPDVPRPWWKRWRWMIPTAALATTGAIVLLIVVRPGGELTPITEE